MNPLKICLIGYGRMGHMIEKIARSRGHEIVLRIDRDDEKAFDSEAFASAEVAIEFSTPETAYQGCRRALEQGLTVVSGTTGWSEGIAQLRELCRQNPEMSFLWASNFSLGVQLFLELNKQAAKIMRTISQYHLDLEEVHHIHKLDAPSGTAITLAETILHERPDLSRWELRHGHEELAPTTLPITAHREGEVAGIHRSIYTSSVDRIILEHEAFSREGFALGAVIAAEYASRHHGALEMASVVQELIHHQA